MESLLASLGPVTAVIGAQWGDEGKGKAVDMLAERFDVIARANGGANAGHTIIVGDKKHVFNLLPSGCLHEGKQIVLGAGMVIHLPTLLREIAVLRDAGIDIVDRLSISPAAHIVFEYHKRIDEALETRRSAEKGGAIGTTKRGIGPAYADKASRTGVRMERLGEDLRDELTHKADTIRHDYGVDVDIEEELAALREAAALIGHRVTDTVELLHATHRAGKTILIEGAQASLLDIDHGTYPHVTSSATTAAGAMQGLGLAPRMLTSCIGVAKAYCTRVGGGPFPLEETGETGDRLRERGGEYGATTGRPRRCGWLHIADLKRAALINGFTHWNITKLDVLDEEESLPVGIETIADGTVRTETLPGWNASTGGITAFDALPENARSYIRFIEEQTDIPVALIGTGPRRADMVIRA